MFTNRHIGLDYTRRLSVYNYFRTYDPSTGRYLESDPIGLDGGLNTYGYALQNPLSYSDPYGQTPAAGALCFVPGIGYVSCAALAVGSAAVAGICIASGTCADFGRSLLDFFKASPGNPRGACKLLTGTVVGGCDGAYELSCIYQCKSGIYNITLNPWKRQNCPDVWIGPD